MSPLDAAATERFRKTRLFSPASHAPVARPRQQRRARLDKIVGLFGVFLAEDLSHDVPARSLAPERRISSLLEGGHISSKAIARRIRINGISFEHGRPVSCRVLFSSRHQLL